MKNKKIIRLFTAALAVALCATAFAVPAFAGGGDGEPYYTETAGTEAAPTGDAESPEVTVTDDEDTAGNNDTQAGLILWISLPNCSAVWGPSRSPRRVSSLPLMRRDWRPSRSGL